jgi:hypothetical protein
MGRWGDTRNRETEVGVVFICESQPHSFYAETKAPRVAIERNDLRGHLEFCELTDIENRLMNLAGVEALSDELGGVAQ